MRKRGNRIALCLVALLLASAAVGPRAEVSADTQNGVLLLILGITEGPDPIPQVIWEPVRDVDASLFLNTDGGPRGDGRPAAANHPDTSRPHVVWAFNAGTDRDIAYSFWLGTEWEEVEFLTSSISDDVDPRISVSDSGTIYVVWWDADLGRVWMSTRETGVSTWEDPEPITGVVDLGRRPSILEWEDTVLIAYERDETRSGQEVVVATRVSEGVYDREVVATTPSQLPLNVILHNEQGVIWIDWRHSDTEYAYSVFSEGVWGQWQSLPWTDDSWSRSEEIRQVIRGAVLGQ